MNRKLLKSFLPKRLLPRLLMIFLIPLIIIQCSVIFFFYDRHWEKIINRFSNIASNEINLIINTYEKEGIERTKDFANDLNIRLSIHNEIPKILQRRSILEEKVYKTIKSRVNKNIDVNFREEFVAFYMKFDDEILQVNFPRKYLLSETPIIYILWIVSTSLVLSLIAFLFMRIQIRAIYRLSKSAEDFGRGKEILNFKPEGAMEIRSAGNAFLKMKRRINNYIDQRTSFLAGISHDLGTIITRIKLRLELLDNKKETSQIKKDIEVMQGFLKEYLDYSKETNVNKSVKINISDLINEVVDLSKFKDKKIYIKCARTINIHNDKGCLYRIISNLFENACKYGETVAIFARKKNGNVIIDIEDNGPGIKNEFRLKVFKPFYKIDDSRNLNTGGSGLGLSIAKDLARKIGVKITLKNSKKYKGSCFSTIIPKVS